MNSEALLGNVATESREGFFMASVSDFSNRGSSDFRRVVEGFLLRAGARCENSAHGP